MMKCVFGMRMNIEVFYKFILSFCVCVVKHAQSTQIKKFLYILCISRKTWEMNLVFCPQINTNVFYNLIVSLWVCVARHTQSTQNSKFAISSQYLRENVKNEVDFLPADKHQRFLQIDAVVF